MEIRLFSYQGSNTTYKMAAFPMFLVLCRATIIILLQQPQQISQILQQLQQISQKLDFFSNTSLRQNFFLLPIYHSKQRRLYIWRACFQKAPKNPKQNMPPFCCQNAQLFSISLTTVAGIVASSIYLFIRAAVASKGTE